MNMTIQIIVFLLAAVLWRNAVGKGPLEAIVAATTGWLRTLVLTGHRAGPRTGEGRPVPAPGAGSGDERGLEGGSRRDDSRGDGTRAGEAQASDLVTGPSGPSGQPG